MTNNNNSNSNENNNSNNNHIIYIMILQELAISCISEHTTTEALTGHRVKRHLKRAVRGRLQEWTADQKWQRSLLKTRWEDEKLNKEGCFAWLNEWQCTPTHTTTAHYLVFHFPTDAAHSFFRNYTPYAEHTFVRANRVDALFVNHWIKQVVLAEMSCRWLDNREKNEVEKTEKYGPLRFELSRRYSGYKIVPLNVNIDVLGGWYKEVEVQMRETFGTRTNDALKRMQKAVISSSLTIARKFKVRVA